MGDEISNSSKVLDGARSCSIEVSASFPIQVAMQPPDLKTIPRQASIAEQVVRREKSKEQQTLEESGTRTVDVGESMGVRLRLLGGLAFKKLCPSANDPDSKYYRENKDMDLMGKREDSKKIMKVMETLGYKPREVFNKLNMGQRLIYYDTVNKRRIDIFLDEFVMCHKFNFKESIPDGVYTLPLTQLVMTKLQVVEKTEKEYLDLLAAFKDFDVIEGKKGKGILGDEIAELASKDWGIYTTFKKSLEALQDKTETLDSEDKKIIVPRIQKLTAMIDEKPKSFGWKMRARIGEKARWYDLPDTSDTDPALHSPA